MEENRDNITENNINENTEPVNAQPSSHVHEEQSVQNAIPQPQGALPPTPPGYPTPQYGMAVSPFIASAAPAAEQKKKIDFNGTELLYSFIAFVMSFLLIRYAICSPTGFLTTAIFIALFTAGIVFMKRSGAGFDGRTRFTAGLGYVFSLVYSITANEFIKALNSVFLCVVFIWLLDRLGSEDRRIPRFLPFVLAKAVFDRPLSNMELMPKAVAQSAKKTELGKNIGFTVIGLIAAIIPTMIVGSLLMSADSGVERMLGYLVDLIFADSIFTMAVQLCFAVPLGCYLFGLLFSNAHRDPAGEVTDDSCELKLAAARKLQNMILYAAVTPICLLYLLFFISQASYLLSAFNNTLPEGFSYAEFARRGFFELLAIALINLAVIIIMNLVAKQGGRNKPAGLKIYTMLIGFFTLVVIASALSKMVMYISVYGLTELRIYTGWFMVLCAFAFIMIMIKQLRDGFQIWRYLTAVFIVMFGVLCFSRPDDIIARYNIEMSRAGVLSEYGENGNEYLLTLSDDAYAVYLDYGCDKREGISEKERNALLNRRMAYDFEPLRVMNISSLRVKNRIS